MICIACRIEAHASCIREPECDCGCNPPDREFSSAQLAIIEALENDMEDETGTIESVYINPPYTATQIETGTYYTPMKIIKHVRAEYE